MNSRRNTSKKKTERKSIKKTTRKSLIKDIKDIKIKKEKKELSDFHKTLVDRKNAMFINKSTFIQNLTGKSYSQLIKNNKKDIEKEITDSYTHLTLTTNVEVYISVVAV